MVNLTKLFRMKPAGEPRPDSPRVVVALSRSALRGDFVIEREQRDSPKNGGALWMHRVRRASKKAAEAEYETACREARDAFPDYEAY